MKCLTSEQTQLPHQSCFHPSHKPTYPIPIDLQPHSSLSASPFTSPYPDLYTGTRGAEEDKTTTSHPVPFPLFCNPPSPSISPSTTPFLDLQYTRCKLSRSKPKHRGDGGMHTAYTEQSRGYIGATLLKPYLPWLYPLLNGRLTTNEQRVLSSHRDLRQNFKGVDQVIGVSCVVVITDADARLCVIQSIIWVEVIVIIINW
ncbi:hypothetical protein Cgig2_004502 [Carnegiea gigantea]|uniref:Uncharacterized protein n=1 Tax=Carnegiea gigantea TaxID=171969 RepID=A0A9Q1JKH5_9CARY|nr:hypothetical protein Cgig2_004502 [Carnegiea gigantea]